MTFTTFIFISNQLKVNVPKKQYTVSQSDISSKIHYLCSEIVEVAIFRLFHLKSLK